MAPLDVAPIPRINRWIVARFLAVQLLRALDTREILAALLEIDRDSPLTPQEVREHHTELIWDPGQIELLARRFRRSIWLFAQNDSATPFVTSDNPMAFRTPKLCCPGTALALPKAVVGDFTKCRLRLQAPRHSPGSS